MGDIVRGIILALEHIQGFRIYNIGSGSPIELLPLVEMIGDILGKKPRINMAPMQKGDVTRTYADVTRAKTELGFSPNVALRDGLVEMAKWMNEQDPEDGGLS